jgi:hypothetical protein
VGGWMVMGEGWMGGRVKGGRVGEWMGGWVGEWMGGWVDGWMGGRVDGWMGGGYRVSGFGYRVAPGT